MRKIALLVVSHLDFSKHLVQAAERIVGKQTHLHAVTLPAEESLPRLAQEISQAIRHCFQGTQPSGQKNQRECEGVLILTDLFGSTPTNLVLSEALALSQPVEIVSGVNLPMLLSALSNRGHLSLKELAEKVMADGRKGIQNGRVHFLAEKNR